ncbi:MAG: ABC transporter ATP-binding protein [Verrucomicrobiota bacterium]|nr:ABC transporter ATP-binding protein [Verrucomicrobiota bacterium]
MKRFLPYLIYLRQHWSALAWALICGLIFGASSGFGVPFFVDKVFKAIFEGKEAAFGLSAGLAATLLPVIFLVRGVAGYFCQYLLNYCGQVILRGVRYDLFKKLQELPLQFFERNASGDLLSRLASDTALFQVTVLNLANDLVRQPITFIGGLGYLIYLSITQKESLFILLFIAVGPVIAYPVRLIGKQLKRRGKESQEFIGKVSEQLTENFAGVVEVRSFNLEARELKRMDTGLQAYLRTQMKLTKYYSFSQPLMEFIAALVLAVSFYYGYGKGIPLSTFLSMGLALYFCFDPLKKILRLQNDVQRTYGALDRIEEVLNAPVTIRDAVKPRAAGRLNGTIAFESVHFSYGDEPVFRGLSVSIPAGKVCALVGPSGAGKTTFAKLVPRFYDVSSGAIKVDGVDVREFGLHDLRSQIAVVPQSTVLFNDTVTNNLLIGKPGASFEEVVAAAKAARADEFIRQLPMGYDTNVGEDAVRLSGGQRQRLAIARAFLKNAPILILDEAMSALDSESETKIQEALNNLIAGKTVLTIAHRLSTIKRADMILVFEKGQIIAQGRHEELIESNPLYRQLCQLQNLAP